MTLRTVRRLQRGNFVALISIVLAGVAFAAIVAVAKQDRQPQPPHGLPFGMRLSMPSGAARLAAGSSLFSIPNSAHVAGAAGTNWRSDVEVHNPGSTQASYTIALLKRDADNSSPATQTFTLGPWQSARHADIIDSVFHFNGAAALRITATAGTVIVASRTYNLMVPGNPLNLPAGATFGQFVPAWTDADAIGSGEEARMIQLAHSTSLASGFRTNVGFVNATFAPLDLRVDLFLATGTPLGAVPLSLRAFEFKQIDKIFEKVGAGQVDDGYAVVRTTTAGGKFFTYASVIDNPTGDPVCVTPARLAASAPPTPTPTPSSVNLLPYTPTGWAGPVVPDSTTGTHTTTRLLTYANTYVDWAVINQGPGDITTPITFELRVDGRSYQRWSFPADGLKSGFYAYAQDFVIPGGTFSPGDHTLTIVADPDNVIPESNESDNTWGKTWTWTDLVFAPPLNVARVPGPPIALRIGRSARGAAQTNPAETAAAAPALFIPNSAHVAGAAGTNWRSDVEVHNPGSTIARYSIALLKRDTDNSIPAVQSFMLAPGGSARYTDIIDTVFHFSGAAALRITPLDGNLVVTSRTYNLMVAGNPLNLPAGATFGQFVPAWTDADAIGFGEEARLIQLSHSSSLAVGFRTNVGFLNAGSSAISLVADLYRSDGLALGTVPVDLRAYEFKQIDRIFERVGASTVDDGFAVVRTTTSGGRFFTYASVIDNPTGDPVCVTPWRMLATVPPTPTPTATPPAEVQVSISPAAVTLVPEGTQKFTATVTGSADTNVTWGLQDGGVGGTITSGGVYTAPNTPGAYEVVVATSQADPTKKATAVALVTDATPGSDYYPRPLVPGSTTAESKTFTTTAGQPATVSLSDGTRLDIPALSSPATVTLARSSNTLDLSRAQQQVSGSMRTVTYSGDLGDPECAPLLTFPAREAGLLRAVNVARVGDLLVGGATLHDRIVFLPATTDASGNVNARDVFLRTALQSAGVSAQSAAPATLTVKYSVSTYQGNINWAREPQLLRMIPDPTVQPAGRRPLAQLSQAQRDEILRKPIKNVVLLVHGHNEAEGHGYGLPEINSPWWFTYKRDVWTPLYGVFQTSDAAFLDCTAFYEFIYPSYRPVFGDGEALGAVLARLLLAEPRLKAMTQKYNLFVVAHSMGGLVARAGMNQLDSSVEGHAMAQNFVKLVTWGTPHHGSPAISLRWLLTSGYNLDIPGACFDGYAPSLETLNEHAFYRDGVECLAADTPGERDLRWDNSKPLNLERTGGWKLAKWQEGDRARYDPTSNPDLYNDRLKNFNAQDRFAMTDKYTFFDGITTKGFVIDWSCASLKKLKSLPPTGQGATLIKWLYNNGDVLTAYPNQPSVKESDGAVPVDSMVGLGLTSFANAVYLGDVDHEEYYGAAASTTASRTLETLKFKDAAKTCDCPYLEVAQIQRTPPTAQASGKVIWPGDAKPGLRVRAIAVARTRGTTRSVTSAQSSTINDDGTFVAVFDSVALDPPAVGEALDLLAQLKDGSELSAPASAKTPFNAVVTFRTSLGTYRDNSGSLATGSVWIGRRGCSGQYSGSTFTCSWDDQWDTGQITLVLTPKFDAIASVTYDDVERALPRTTTYGLGGTAIPLLSTSSSGFLFKLQGTDTCAHVTRATQSDVYAGDSYTSTLESYLCNAGSYLSVELVNP